MTAPRMPHWPAHVCPAKGCREVVADGYVGCRDHWQQLPAHERQVLADAFRNRTVDPGLFAAARHYAWQRVEAL